MQQTKTLLDVNENKQIIIAYYYCAWKTCNGTNLWVTLNENICILLYIFVNKKP